jgi:hypothetical protein
MNPSSEAVNFPEISVVIFNCDNHYCGEYMKFKMVKRARKTVPTVELDG